MFKADWGSNGMPVHTNPGRRSTYRCGKTVQTTGTTSNNAGCVPPQRARFSVFWLCWDDCREQFLKLQIKAVASPRNQSKHINTIDKFETAVDRTRSTTELCRHRVGTNPDLGLQRQDQLA